MGNSRRRVQSGSGQGGIIDGERARKPDDVWSLSSLPTWFSSGFGSAHPSPFLHNTEEEGYPQTIIRYRAGEKLTILSPPFFYVSRNSQKTYIKIVSRNRSIVDHRVKIVLKQEDADRLLSGKKKNCLRDSNDEVMCSLF